ncbi:hypothetical protein FJT64_016049 [Amphibalanus amphitrite]|uniref:Uncharacterized protein n=1 Tax=Amphibalanus amphitrite TaxID=1232801 RepID=A0A6A4XFL7_AMPAM|nr:hypothetical protein FJT64_016049 [Amphibalanus amphitrite]
MYATTCHPGPSHPGASTSLGQSSSGTSRTRRCWTAAAAADGVSGDSEPDLTRLTPGLGVAPGLSVSEAHLDRVQPPRERLYRPDLDSASQNGAQDFGSVQLESVHSLPPRGHLAYDVLTEITLLPDCKPVKKAPVVSGDLNPTYNLDYALPLRD